MPAYLVRLKHDDEEHARELVGIFVAESMEDLFWLVDEAASPGECECVELRAGGIYWEGYTKQTVPRDVEPDWDKLPDDWGPLPPGPALTDDWDSLFSADDGPPDEAWGPIVWPADEEEPATVRKLPPLPPRGRPRRR